MVEEPFITPIDEAFDQSKILEQVVNGIKQNYYSHLGNKEITLRAEHLKNNPRVKKSKVSGEESPVYQLKLDKALL